MFPLNFRHTENWSCYCSPYPNYGSVNSLSNIFSFDSVLQCDFAQIGTAFAMGFY